MVWTRGLHKFLECIKNFGQTDLGRVTLTWVGLGETDLGWVKLSWGTLTWVVLGGTDLGWVKLTWVG